jgi:hypothetical protein
LRQIKLWVDRHWFWGCAALLLGLQIPVQITTALEANQTWDEAMELASGYSYLRTGQFRIQAEQPPLAKILAALPLLPFAPRLPLDHFSWQKREDRLFGEQFLYHNRLPADTLVLAGRLPSILTTLALGLALALWTRRVFGPAAALFALLLFSFDPNIIAVGRYIKSDLPVTLLSFLVCIAWTGFLMRPRWGAAALSGVLLGLALTAKFSAAFLVPVLVVLYLLRRWQQGGERVRPPPALALAAAFAIAFLVVLAVYAPDGLLFGRAARDQGLVRGLKEFAAHAKAGHMSYLLGRRPHTGWWYYFPLAFAVKTPVATLLAVSLALAVALKAARGRMAAALAWLRRSR